MNKPLKPWETLLERDLMSEQWGIWCSHPIGTGWVIRLGDQESSQETYLADSKEEALSYLDQVYGELASEYGERFYNVQPYSLPSDYVPESDLEKGEDTFDYAAEFAAELNKIDRVLLIWWEGLTTYERFTHMVQGEIEL